MEKKFTSDEVPLAQLLDQARAGTLQLPDFQRGWVWDDSHIRSLLASISLSYPIGAVMTLQTGNPEVKFQPRPLEGVALERPVEPEFLLLDGQQRMTSLYLALRSGEPVQTRDDRRNPLSRRYFADIARCIDDRVDREEAIVGVSGDGYLKSFGGEVIVDVSTRDRELAAGMFPLDIALDQAGAMKWMLEYLEQGGDDSRVAIWQEFNERVLTPFVQYQVPTIQLIRATPKEAVCQVFEKVNTGGVSLTVFELLTATYAADNFNLRDDWEARRERLDRHAVLDRVEETHFVQIVTLLATLGRRLEHLADSGDPDKAPAVSCKRRDMLRLPLADYERWAEPATDALERIVPFLLGEHVFSAPDIPYDTQLVPLAAIFAVLGEQAEGLGARTQLARWYWCGVFGEMYGGSTETRFALDLVDVVAWIRAGGEEPRTIRDAQFQAERLLTLKTRNAAAYKGLYALQMKRGARDFRTGNAIDVHAYVDDAIDIHHVFPQHWCAANGIERGTANSVVNKTPIDAHTNRRIGGNAPSSYLAAIAAEESVADTELDAILQSHEIDPLALRADDFPAFFNQRFERLLKLIEAAMGKAVNRSAERDESPFVEERDSEVVRDAVQALLAGGESRILEFKSTGRKSLASGQRDKRVEWGVVKTLAGFMNAHGGTLLVGVGDDGAPVGIEEDFPLLGKQDRDGWELWLGDLVGSSLGRAAAAELDVTVVEIGGRQVARIVTGPAPEPVFAKDVSDGGRQVFLVRVGNSTRELSGPDALAYQRSRWPG